MNKKTNIFYVSDRIYPSGNAGGVRILHIASMLKNFFKVNIVTFNNKSAKKYEENNIIHFVIPFKTTHKLFSFINNYLLSGLRSLIIIKKNICPRSSILIYSTNIFFIIPIFYLKFKGHKLFFDVVENYSKNNFSAYLVNPKYYFFKIVYYLIYPRSDGNFCISSHIKNSFPEKLNTFILPPLYKKRCNNIISCSDRQISKYSIIYSGMPFGKENLTLMFKILEKLLAEGFKFDFHFTGIEKNRLLKKTSLNTKYPNLYQNIHIHGFLSQVNLHKLYIKSHFTFFLRNNYPSNISCFPMKLIEMMNFGIIPIISNTGDYGENLTDTNDSFIFQNLDEDYCLKKFSSVLLMGKDELIRISTRATQFVNDYDPYSFYQSHKSELTKFLFK